MTIRKLDRREALQRLPEFVALLRDSVEHGHSIGFLLPFEEALAVTFWQGVLHELLLEEDADKQEASRHLFIAEEEGRIIGTVQLSLAPRQNSRHRAEVQKMIVHSTAQRRGIASQLLQHAEDFAHKFGRTLLILDTETECAAAKLYEKLGWQLVGKIPRFAADTRGELVICSIYFKELILS
jgi:acetyltransferase